MITPSAVSCSILSIPGHTAGSCAELPRLPLASLENNFLRLRAIQAKVAVIAENGRLELKNNILLVL